ncbi:MAG: phage protein NinX family protein, partial [Pseudomonas sp.]
MTDMIEVKTADLSGLALDWAVGIADGRELELPSQFRSRTCVVWCDPYVVKREGNPDFHDKTRRQWKPTTDWAHGG